jgi:glutamine synthetase
MSVFASLHEAHTFLEQHPHIEMFELFILDNNGVPRGKLLHRDELLAVYESGRPLPSTILGLTINGDDVENSGLVWDVGDIDCRAYPSAAAWCPALAPDPDCRGAGQHAPHRRPARHGRRPAHVLAKVIEGSRPTVITR